MQRGQFKVIGLDKQVYLKPDEYLNGYAKYCGWKATLTFDSLCRHADRNRESFPSIALMAEELGVSYNTVRRGIEALEKWNIVLKKRKRRKDGKLLNNTYFILAKEHWKKPQPPQGYGSSTAPTGKSHSPHRAIKDIKDTHTKDTHVLSKDNTEKKPSYGNNDINSLIERMKQILELPMLDGSDKQNRQYCWLAIKKFGGVEKVSLLIDTLSKDNFWKHKITSFQQLYYKGVQIISGTRGGGNGKIYVAPGAK